MIRVILSLKLLSRVSLFSVFCLPRKKKELVRRQYTIAQSYKLRVLFLHKYLQQTHSRYKSAWPLQSTCPNTASPTSKEHSFLSSHKVAIGSETVLPHKADGSTWCTASTSQYSSTWQSGMAP